MSDSVLCPKCQREAVDAFIRDELPDLMRRASSGAIQTNIQAGQITRRIKELRDISRDDSDVAKPSVTRFEVTWRKALEAAVGSACRCQTVPHLERCPVRQYGFTAARELLEQNDGR